MQYVAPLIAEAWEQHRRRRARLITAAVAAAALAALAWLASGGLRNASGGSGGLAGAGTGIVTVQASTVLSRSPSMGVHPCHPNSRTCYRVGLAVSLKRPALSVTAVVAGAHASRNRAENHGIQLISFGRQRDFLGFFRPAGIVPRAYLRTPDATSQVPTAVVRLTIDRGRGQPLLVTRVRVPVEAGWG